MAILTREFNKSSIQKVLITCKLESNRVQIDQIFSYHGTFFSNHRYNIQLATLEKFSFLLEFVEINMPVCSFPFFKVA